MTLLASVFLGALAAATAANAQTYYDVNPYTIDNSTKKAWCTTQVAACPLLCKDQGSYSIVNSCYPENLVWSCICEGNIPINATEYSQTIPYFLCTQSVSNCVTDCGGNPICGENCRTNKKCGATDPTRVNITSTSTTMTSTSGGASTPTDGIYTGFAGDGAAQTTAPSSDKGNAGGMGRTVMVAETYGLGLLLAGFAAGFMMLAN